MLFRIKLQQILLLSFGILSFATNAEVIDGINYRLKALNYTPSSGINKYQATVIAPIEGMSYCGDIVIPQTIKGPDGNTYVVETTAQNAFKGQHELKSITIERDFYPTSTYILNPDKYKDGFIRATQEFKDCDKLEAINCEKRKDPQVTEGHGKAGAILLMAFLWNNHWALPLSIPMLSPQVQ